MTRLRALVVTLSLGALLAGGLSVLAFLESQRAGREARLATARELGAAAVGNLEVDAERSVLLALEAIEVTRTTSSASRSACNRPLLVSAPGPAQESFPRMSVIRPPASATTMCGAARSQVLTPCSSNMASAEPWATSMWSQKSPKPRSRQPPVAPPRGLP
ncbi:MAG TPA: hypothetical protein VMP67_01900 [Candidatus Limnocylindria bacterium]|nr:hypothetical protein [Candidatus Limnocylindria bacterium]